MKALRRFTVRAQLPARLSGLAELSVNLRWSWHTPTLELFESIDPALWVSGERDPGRILGEVDPDRLSALAEDDGFVRRVDELVEDLHSYLDRPRWFQKQVDGGADLPSGIAYFSMEFGVSEVLPNYSGGLGILAGD